MHDRQGRRGKSAASSLLHTLIALGLAAWVSGCGGPAPDPATLEPAKVTRVEPGSQERDSDVVFARAERAERIDRPGRESIDAPIGVYFSEVWSTPQANKANPKNIAEHCVRFIDAARSTLDVCGFEIDNERIIDAVLRAARRGVRVRVVTDSDYLEEAGPRAFLQAGIPVLSDQRSALMHNKFLVVDNQAVWTGSFNFTENCAYKNNNNAVSIQFSRLAANYAEKFRWFWEYKKFGGRPFPTARIPYPVIRMDDGTVVENYYSTHDGVDRKVIARLQDARRSIKFMAFSFTHEGIAGALIERAEAGVSVVGVVEARQNSRSSEMERLANVRGVEVLPDGNKYNMHHKVFIIDDAVVITGSYNFSTSATKDNDENLLVIHNRKVAERFADEFARVHRAAAGALSSQPANSLRR